MTGQTPFFYVFLYGNTRDISKLKRVSVRGLPGEVVLDSTPGSGRGSLKIKHDKPGYDTFFVQREMPALPSDGGLSLRFDGCRSARPSTDRSRFARSTCTWAAREPLASRGASGWAVTASSGR